MCLTQSQTHLPKDRPQACSRHGLQATQASQASQASQVN